MGYNPQESLENPINTIGTRTLGVHPSLSLDTWCEWDLRRILAAPLPQYFCWLRALTKSVAPPVPKVPWGVDVEKDMNLRKAIWKDLQFITNTMKHPWMKFDRGFVMKWWILWVIYVLNHPFGGLLEGHFRITSSWRWCCPIWCQQSILSTIFGLVLLCCSNRLCVRKYNLPCGIVWGVSSKNRFLQSG